MADHQGHEANPQHTGLLIQLLRGLDNGMPQGVRPMWNKVTPDLQRMKLEEAAQMAAQQQAYQQGGADPGTAQAVPEYQNYRQIRQ